MSHLHHHVSFVRFAKRRRKMTQKAERANANAIVLQGKRVHEIIVRPSPHGSGMNAQHRGRFLQVERNRRRVPTHAEEFEAWHTAPHMTCVQLRPLRHGGRVTAERMPFHGQVRARFANPQNEGSPFYPPPGGLETRGG